MPECPRSVDAVGGRCELGPAAVGRSTPALARIEQRSPFVCGTYWNEKWNALYSKNMRGLTTQDNQILHSCSRAASAPPS